MTCYISRIYQPWALTHPLASIPLRESLDALSTDIVMQICLKMQVASGKSPGGLSSFCPVAKRYYEIATPQIQYIATSICHHASCQHSAEQLPRTRP